MTSVLHIIPASVFSNTYHGCYKDVLGRVQWFERMGFDYRALRIEKDDPAEVMASLRTAVPSHVLIEYTHFPRIASAIRSAFPTVCLVVRAHNIEPLQHYDNHGWWPRKGPPWLLYGMARLLTHDIQVKRCADFILSINDWENRVYWNRLPGRAVISWLPYACPQGVIPASTMDFASRRMIACLPTSQKNRKSWDLVMRFQKVAGEMKRRGCPDEFVITGCLDGWNIPECCEVTRIGFVDDLSAFLGTCKAVAMLSPLGYGFKTTMADAFAAGAHVLAHPSLVRRSPALVAKALIPVDSSHAATLDSVQHRLAESPTGSQVHASLASGQHEVMHQVFGGAT